MYYSWVTIALTRQWPEATCLSNCVLFSMVICLISYSRLLPNDRFIRDVQGQDKPTYLTPSVYWNKSRVFLKTFVFFMTAIHAYPLGVYLAIMLKLLAWSNCCDSTLDLNVLSHVLFSWKQCNVQCPTVLSSSDSCHGQESVCVCVWLCVCVGVMFLFIDTTLSTDSCGLLYRSGTHMTLVLFTHHYDCL